MSQLAPLSATNSMITSSSSNLVHSFLGGDFLGEFHLIFQPFIIKIGICFTDSKLFQTLCVKLYIYLQLIKTYRSPKKLTLYNHWKCKFYIQMLRPTPIPCIRNKCSIYLNGFCQGISCKKRIKSEQYNYGKKRTYTWSSYIIHHVDVCI